MSGYEDPGHQRSGGGQSVRCQKKRRRDGQLKQAALALNEEEGKGGVDHRGGFTLRHASAPSSGRLQAGPLLRSSSTEQGECIPTAFCGRGPACGSRPDASTRGCDAAAKVPLNQKAGRGQTTFGFGRPLKPDVTGRELPSEIRCNELVRAVLQTANLPSGFQCFARKSLTPLRDVDGPFTARSDCWPCPSPVWGRWTATGRLSPRRRGRLRFLETKALCLQAVVVALNWITLGRAHSPPECGRVGFPMSSQQHDMLERLEDLIDYFLSAPTASLESLGRSGEKLAQLAKQAFLLRTPSKIDLNFEDIHSFLDYIQVSFDPYTHKRRKTSKKEPTASSHLGKDSVREEAQPVRITSLGSTAKPVVADRIKWKLAPAFDPGPFLSDSIVRRAYVDPDVLRRPSADWPKLARARSMRVVKKSSGLPPSGTPCVLAGSCPVLELIPMKPLVFLQYLKMLNTTG